MISPSHIPVLLVDDNAMVRQSTATQLRSLGFSVQEASSGESALEILQKNEEIDLLLSDVLMPNGMNGVSLADKALELKPDLKVLLVSGYVNVDRSSFQYRLLPKPYRKQDLMTAIEAVFGLGSMGEFGSGSKSAFSS